VICPGNPGHGSRFFENTAGPKLHSIIASVSQFREQQLQKLKDNPNESRELIRTQWVSQNPGIQCILDDTDRDIEACVQLMLMVDCSHYQIPFAGFKVDDYQPTTWESHESLSAFLTRSFPMNRKENVDAIEAWEKDKHALKAWKLRKRAHLNFLPTDNLTEHLLLDKRSGSVRVFHHTAWLKSQLRRSISLRMDSDMSDCLQMGTLPPRLLVETLDSIQFILFAPYDSKSSRLLKNLVKFQNFDKDCEMHDGHIREIPLDFEYKFWGTRLATLYHAVKNPEPSGPIHSWLRRHANEKNGLIVAIVALVLSAFFSLLGVIIGIVQTWLAWKAWKHPAA